ncbi:MAG: Mor transcription activator family protein [Clostridia bacterium]|nr:Mor transcription activator family protein [Clostridia bacterium]
MDKKDADLFNEVYREISTTVGTEAAVKIFQMYKGQQISFPVHLFNSKRIQSNIASEYDGTNIKELAKKYAYSEKTVRRMIKENIKD